MLSKSVFFRFTAMVMTAAIAVTSISACSSKGQGAASKTQDPGKQQETVSKSDAGTKTNDKPVEIKTFMVEKADVQITNQMAVIKELGKRTNVNMKFELAPESNHKERYNIMIASGDIADLVVYERDDIFRFVEKGVFEPLDDLIDKYAPNLKKELSKYPDEMKNIKQTDGKIYTLHTLKGNIPTQMFIMRMDWLENLGMQVPDTVEDWYNVLKAFKDKDPNKSGKKDIVPFTSIDGRNNVKPFIYSWGIDEGFFIEDNKVKYGAADPRMKEALTYLNKLYTEGLIEKEYISIDRKQRDAKIANEQSGATHEWAPRIDQFNQDTKKINPKAQFEAVLPPKGPTGKRMTRLRNEVFATQGTAAISASSKYKKEIIKMYDYIFSDEGTILMNNGLAGEHYTMVNGKPQGTDFVKKNPQGLTSNIALFSVGVLSWPKGKILDPYNGFSKERTRAYEIYEPYTPPAYPSLKFTEDEKELLNSKIVEINTYVNEMLDKMIMGLEPLDKFDDFVKNLKKIGLDDAVKVHEKAYVRYNK